MPIGLGFGTKKSRQSVTCANSFPFVEEELTSTFSLLLENVKLVQINAIKQETSRVFPGGDPD